MPRFIRLQKKLTLPAKARGCHFITNDVLRALPDLAEVDAGLLHLFLQHTSASLTVTENTDPDVRQDLEMALDRLAPETLPYRHTDEGPDDMPAHVKCSLLGVGLLIPVMEGKLALGTWQALCLWEHRDNAPPRSVIATLIAD